MARKPILSAGGVVVRKGARPLIAVVQRSKDESWVLPRGKLKPRERPRAGARREAVEETGHKMSVREFLGAIAYRADGGPKVVQLWHMRAAKNPSRDPARDIAAVAWLPLAKAVARLTYPLERLFLQSVGGALVRKRSKRKLRKATARAARKKSSKKAAKRER